MAENQKLQLENYKNLEKQLKETMNREQTVDSQTSFMKMKKQRENLEGNILKKRWYGDEKASDDNRTRDTSLLERGLNLLNTPLYGVVGATEAVLGKGSKRGLSNIGANIEEGGTFGDLLRSYNMNNAAAMPLGFALDLAFDPLIWATGGATALIPRVAYGATKAGIKGAGKGAASSFLQKAATASKIMPGVPTKKLTAKALKSGAEYNEMVGRSIKQILEKPRGVGNLPPLGEITEDFLSRSKVGRQVIDKFKLGNRDWLEEQMMSDITRRAKIAEGTRITGKPQELGEKALAATGDAGPSVLGKGTFKNDLDILSNPTKYIGRDEISDVSEVQKILDLGAQAATDSSTMARTLGKNLEGKMTQEFLQDKKLQDVWQKYKKTAKEISKDETGVKWFDNMEKKFKEDFVVRDKKVGQAIADTYEAFIGAFKTAKVPWNSAAYTNAVVGNLVMGQMAGLQMYNPEYMKNIVKSFKFVNNKLNKDDQLKFLKNFTDDAEWVKYIDEFPGTFTNVFGFDPKFFKGSAKELVSDAVQESAKKFKGASAPTLEELMQAETLINQAKKVVPKKGRKLPGVLETLKGGRGETPPSSFFASELNTGGFDKMLANIDGKIDANPDSKFWKGLKWYFEKPMDLYSSLDQSYKIGTAVKLTKTGATERELLTLKRFMDIRPKDILDTGEGLYKLKPHKAVEAAQEVFMNYGAMPGAVKVLRSLPFMGAPFASFMYGMGTKTAKTIQHNPAVFNKISNALHEFQGGTTPLEREKLKEPYYQYYNRDGMIKLPFFKDNPVYLNMANMIPYYTMNMFQPAERKYDDKLTGNIMGTLDKLPFFKTPEGQVMLDYFVQPLILRESNPVGMFDQPIWPRDASGLEKVGYAARQMAEAPVPSGAGLLGVPQGIVAPKTVPYTPNFRGRQLGYAVQGKTSLGIPSKEPAMERTVRVLSSTFGVPFYRMNLSYGSSNKKK